MVHRCTVHQALHIPLVSSAGTDRAGADREGSVLTRLRLGKEVHVISLRLHSRSFVADWSVCADDVRLRMSGRLVDPTPANSEWAAALERTAGAHLHVDLAGITDMDGRGLGMLADLIRDRRATGGSVSVVYANARVRRLLDITRLAHAFEARSCACVA